MTTAIDLAGFEAKFSANADPWETWTDHDEAVKRRAILHALGAGRYGRVLELAAGNGSNSRALAGHALRFDATEATVGGTRLVAEALTGRHGTRAMRLVVPAAFPRPTYDAIVIAELLYYLSPRAFATLASQVSAHLAANGTLVLAHHRIDFYDFVQTAWRIHPRFLAGTGRAWRSRIIRRTRRWEVLALTPA